MAHTNSQPLADTKLKEIEQYVTSGYARWSRIRIGFDYKERKGERIVEIMQGTCGLPPRALEIGIGPGGVAKAVARGGPHVVGMDLSPEGLTLARKHCADMHVSLLRASGFDLPFATGSFPVVYASQVLHIFDDEARLKMMREVRRVLAPGGSFIFDMKNLSSHPWRYVRTEPVRRRRNFPSPATILELLRQADFRDVQVRAGLFPLFGSSIGPVAGGLCALSHTRFYVAKAI